MIRILTLTICIALALANSNSSFKKEKTSRFEKLGKDLDLEPVTANAYEHFDEEGREQFLTINWHSLARIDFSNQISSVCYHGIVAFYDAEVYNKGIFDVSLKLIVSI